MKRHLLLTIFIIFSHLIVGSSLAQNSAPTAFAQRDVFIFAGQSNMAGADAVIQESFIFSDTDQKVPYTGAPSPLGNRSPFYCPWGPMKGHPNPRQNREFIIGPEVGFARRLAESGIRDIAIIAAWGNFSRDVEKWPWREGGELNNTWMEFVDDSLAEFRAAGFEPRIKGFVWHQGIDDAIHGYLARNYEKNLTALIEALRRRFHLEDAPFVLARSVNSPIARAITGDGED